MSTFKVFVGRHVARLRARGLMLTPPRELASRRPRIPQGWYWDGTILWHPDDPDAFGRGDECMSVELKQHAVVAHHWPAWSREDDVGMKMTWRAITPPSVAAAFVKSMRHKV